MKSRILVAAAAVAMLSGASAQAATTTTTFAVTAVVLASCNIGTVSTLGFGTYDPTAGANRDATTSVAVTCTIGTPYSIGLSSGTTSGGTVSQRKMQGVVSANKLNYNLYRDASRSLVWGETVLTDTVADIGTGLSQGHTVYGRITSGTSASIDVYSDTITVTVTY